MSTIIGTNPSVYEPGQDITGQATGAVTARRFVKISGNRTNGGNVAVTAAAAGDRALGVAGHDAAVGDLVRVVRGASRVVKVTASGAIAAGAEVQVGANGTAATKAAGVAVGYAITGAVDTADAEISLYA
ncbi:capsid cement protein [Mycobacterium kyogaense]|uniref:capsid cement protein n=1 Tax=Mycobacterium kyogaense TaxID=2212479 RepID=UPI000DACF6DC|nr:capsid cement protein [Mycobacterium kyogaense]